MTFRSLRLSVGQTFLSALVLTFLLTGGAARADEKPSDAQLQPIFNGKDLSGFKVPDPNPWWKVVDGVLVGENDPAKKGHVLYTEKSFDDFVLETDVRYSDNIDSGVMYGKPELQVQFGVSRSLKKDMTGSIYYKGKYPGQAQGVDKVLRLGQWQTVRIEKRGRTSKVWLNGQHVLTWDCPEDVKPGPIGVQIHGGVAMKVEFKSIKVGELK
jgi:hypothetical protein